MSTAPNVAASLPDAKQFPDGIFAQEADREEAAALARRMFSRNLKRYGTDITGISQARSGCVSNPFYRTRRWLRKAAPEARELYVAHVRAFVAALNSIDLDASDSSIQQASLEETEAQGAADVRQLALAARVTPETIRLTIPALEHDIAQSMLLRVRLEKRLLAGTR